MDRIDAMSDDDNPDLQYCYDCGEPECFCDLDTCIECGGLVCPECTVEVETEDGEPLGALCLGCNERQDNE